MAMSGEGLILVTGSAGRIGWNGRDSAGRVVADGRYRIEKARDGGRALDRRIDGIAFGGAAHGCIR